MTRPSADVESMVERVARAMQEADLHDGDEGNHYRLFDLLGFSGENKSVMITRQLARAAIASLPSPEAPIQGWQPIETMPLDGVPVLAVSASWSWPRIIVRTTFGDWRDFTSNVYVDPAYWMPLPMPPLPSPPQESR